MRRLLRPTVLLASVVLAMTASPAIAGPVGGGGGGTEEPEDLSPPRIVVTPDRPAVWQGWYGDTVAVHIRAFDDQGDHDEGLDFVEYALSGATTGTGLIDNDAGTTISISSAGVTNIAIDAWDVQGNLGERDYAVGIDRTRPTVAFNDRLAGDRIFYQGEKVPAAFTCSDVGTEVASCVGPVAAGADLNTSTIGSHVINVEAVDRVGNSARVPLTYHVCAQTFSATSRPIIAGSPVVGETLAVTPAQFSPAPTSSGVRWYRNGQLVASDQGYRLTAADVGASITAVSYANRAGWPEGTSTSDPVSVVGTLEVVGRPTVAGTARVGSLLTARPPVVREPGESRAAGDPAALAYQWLRDGRAIPRATARTYRLTAADAGRRIAVRVTGTVPGYEPAVRTSAATARVAKAVPRLRATVRALGGGRARLTVGATAPGTPVTGVVTVRRGSRVVLRRALTAGALTAVLVRQPPGPVTYTVAYGGSGGVASRTVRVTARLR